METLHTPRVARNVQTSFTGASMSAAQDKHVSPSILEQQVVELRAEVEQLHMALDWATGFLIAHPQDNPAHEAERITALANIGKHERQARAALQSAQKRGIA